MASSSSSGLKDLLSPETNPNFLPETTRPTKPMISSTSPSVVEVLGQKFEELSVESSASSSLLSPFTSQSLQFTMSVPSDTDMSPKENLGEEKEELKSDEGKRGCPEGINIGKEMQHNVNKQVTGRKCFPPPISCLKMVKVGTPYRYLTYDQESDSYVVEEIKIPEGSLFHATREDGRLKLSMNFGDEEESQGSSEKRKEWWKK